MPTLLDRYLLRQLLPVFALCLGTVLIALLLERLLPLLEELMCRTNPKVQRSKIVSGSTSTLLIPCPPFVAIRVWLRNYKIG